MCHSLISQAPLDKKEKKKEKSRSPFSLNSLFASFSPCWTRRVTDRGPKVAGPWLSRHAADVRQIAFPFFPPLHTHKHIIRVRDEYWLKSLAQMMQAVSTTLRGCAGWRRLAKWLLVTERMSNAVNDVTYGTCCCRIPAAVVTVRIGRWLDEETAAARSQMARLSFVSILQREKRKQNEMIKMHCDASLHSSSDDSSEKK